jgi:hypothetical protein
MTSETQTQDGLNQVLIWLAVAIVALAAVYFIFM